MEFQNRAVVFDTHLGVAILAGVIFWAGMWWWAHPVVDISWLIQAPTKFLTLVAVYPVLEEIVFRGGLQPWLLKQPAFQYRWHGLSMANLTTSGVFAAAHLLINASFWSAATFFPSLVFGHFRERHGSLVTPVFLHVFFNSGYFLLTAP